MPNIKWLCVGDITNPFSNREKGAAKKIIEIDAYFKVS
jgi:hypothetical protein